MQPWNDKGTPNPGHEDARKQGCICPVLDNGKGLLQPIGGWWINMNCPVHGQPK